MLSAAAKVDGCGVVVVNVSSLLAVKALPAFSQYATGKAARDMYHAVIASEVCPTPPVSSERLHSQFIHVLFDHLFLWSRSALQPLGNVKTLNYAPGMLRQLEPV